MCAKAERAMKTRTTASTLLLALLCVPSAAQANMGSPLVLAGGLHLTLGNLVIGIVEGLILAKLFGLNKLRAMGWLTLANYLSAGAGVALAVFVVPRLSLNLYNAWGIFWAMVAFTYLLTLVIELPFVALALRGTADWFRKSVRGSLIIQTITYVLLFGWYWLVSSTSLYTKNHVAAWSAMSLPKGVLVYFISARDGDVYCRTLAGLKETKVFNLNSHDNDDRLFVRPSTASNSKRWDLVARLETDNYNKHNFVVVRKSFASEAAPTWQDEGRDPKYYGRNSTWLNVGRVPKLGSAKHSPWEFRSGYWALEGLTGTQKKTDKKVGLSFDTPLLAWRVFNATHLPTDQVLFQLGDDQVCVFDPDTKQIALVTRGRGPIAVMKE